MKISRLGSVVGVVACVLGTSAGWARAQGGGPSSSACPAVRDFAAFHKCALEKMKTFQPKRTPDGKPDMNGIWGPTRSAQDIEEIKKGQYGNFPPSASLIVDPPNGRIPYQDWALKLRTANEQIYISPTAACVPVGVQRWVYSPVSVTGHRIIQQPHQIVTSMERLHSFRIIPIGEGPRRLASDIKLWRGESRGRWDGNRLVIDTTNIDDKVWFDHIGTFVSQGITMQEKMTLIDDNTIHYEATYTDPRVFTQPWTIAIALLRSTAKGMDRLDLEDSSVENCEEEIHHFFNIGQRIFRGFDSIAPKGK